jgi:hypothetical protein
MAARLETTRPAGVYKAREPLRGGLGARTAVPDPPVHWTTASRFSSSGSLASPVSAIDLEGALYWTWTARFCDQQR